MCAELRSKGRRVTALISQLPSLTSYSQQDGPGDVRAEDPGARGRDSVHHSPATWQLGAETLLPQRHDVPHRRPPQHGLVRTRPPALSFLCSQGLFKEKIREEGTVALSSVPRAPADLGSGQPLLQALGYSVPRPAIYVHLPRSLEELCRVDVVTPFY